MAIFSLAVGANSIKIGQVTVMQSDKVPKYSDRDDTINYGSGHDLRPINNLNGRFIVRPTGWSH